MLWRACLPGYHSLDSCFTQHPYFLITKVNDQNSGKKNPKVCPSAWFKHWNCSCLLKWSRPEMVHHPFLFMSVVGMMRWHQTNDLGGLAGQWCSLFHLGTNFTDGEIVLHRSLWDVTYWGQATVETGDGKWSAASILRKCRISSKPMVEYLNDSDSLVEARQAETHLPQFHFFGILFKKMC